MQLIATPFLTREYTIIDLTHGFSLQRTLPGGKPWTLHTACIEDSGLSNERDTTKTSDLVVKV